MLRHQGKDSLFLLELASSWLGLGRLAGDMLKYGIKRGLGCPAKGIPGAYIYIYIVFAFPSQVLRRVRV